MPNPAQFKRGYGLRLGMKLAGYRLSELRVGHTTIDRYREYEYPIEMRWEPDGTRSDPDELAIALHRILIVSGPREIRSSYGNPYECKIAPFREKQESAGMIRITTTGRCVRI